MEQLAVEVLIPQGRLLLREPRVGDAEQVYLEIEKSMDHLRDFLGWAWFPNTLKGQRARIQVAQLEFQEKKSMHGHLILNGESFIGGMGLSLVGSSAMEIGYWISDSYSGKGIATQGVKLACLLGFSLGYISSVLITVNEANNKSWRIPEKLGFQRNEDLIDFDPGHIDLIIKNRDHLSRRTRVYSLNLDQAEKFDWYQRLKNDALFK